MPHIQFLLRVFGVGDALRKLHKDALSLGYVALFVDHCVEEKQKKFIT